MKIKEKQTILQIIFWGKLLNRKTEFCKHQDVGTTYAQQNQFIARCARNDYAKPSFANTRT